MKHVREGKDLETHPEALEVGSGLENQLKFYANEYSFDISKPGEKTGNGKVWHNGDKTLYLIEDRAEVGVSFKDHVLQYLATGTKEGQEQE